MSRRRGADAVAGGAEGVVFTGPRAPQGADDAWLRAMCARVLPLLPSPVARAAVEFVDDARMAAMHGRFMGLPTTTDVLTFAANEPGLPVDVDIAVCVDEAARRGAGRPQGAREELLLYIVHGLLHACGHDDRDEASYRAMHALEDEILERAGAGRLFRAGEEQP